MAFPSTISSFTNPSASDKLNSPSHSSIETAQNNELVQLENVLGVRGSSSVQGTINSAIFSPGSDGGGHVQSANKGGTGQTSFAKGDILIASSSSVLSKQTLGSNNQVLTVDTTQASGVKWATPAGGSPALTIMPRPATGTASIAAVGMVTNTTGRIGLVNVPTQITVNQVSINPVSVLVGGNFKIGLYNEDGQSSVFSLQANVGVSPSVVTTGISSVVVSAGNYWLMIVPTSSVNVQLSIWDNAPFVRFNSSISGKNRMSGLYTVPAETLPETISPSSIAQYNFGTLVTRFDN